MTNPNLEWKVLVEKWAQIARLAPSGGNTQPWNIEASSEKEALKIVIVLVTPENGIISPMDPRGFASVISLGGLCYNFICLAALDGFELISEAYSGENESNFLDTKIHLEFKKSKAKTLAPYLVEVLMARSTNRWGYRRAPDNLNMPQIFQKIVESYSLVKLNLIPDSELRPFTKLISKLEAMRWSNMNFLNAMTREVEFGNREIGLYYKDLGIGLLDTAIIWFLKKSKWFRSVSRYFVPNIAVKSGYINLVNGNIHQGLICVKKYKIQDGIQLGKCLQNLWLESEKHGLAFQVIGSPLIALKFWKIESPSEFSQNEVSTIKEVTDKANGQFDVDLKNPTLGFRFGVSKIKTLPAGRKKLNVDFI